MEANGREEELSRIFYSAHARADALALELKNAAERDYLSVDTKTCTTQYSSRATVGMMLTGCTIDNMVVGGPADTCKQLKKGDTIVRVDGNEVDEDNVVTFLRGQDIPGSFVTIEVSAVGAPHQIKKLTLKRMATEAIADRRALFELFVELLNAAHGDAQVSNLVSSAIDLWTKMYLADAEHDKTISENVEAMQREERAWIAELQGELEKMQLSFTRFMDPKDDDGVRRVVSKQVPQYLKAAPPPSPRDNPTKLGAGPPSPNPAPSPKSGGDRGLFGAVASIFGGKDQKSPGRSSSSKDVQRGGSTGEATGVWFPEGKAVGDVDEVHLELARLQAELVEAKRLEPEVKQLQQIREEAKRVIHELEQEVARKGEGMTEMRQRVEDREAEVERLMDELRQVKAMMQGMSAEAQGTPGDQVRELEAQMRAREEEGERLQRMVAEGEEAMAMLKEREAALRTELEQLRGKDASETQLKERSANEAQDRVVELESRVLELQGLLARGDSTNLLGKSLEELERRTREMKTLQSKLEQLLGLMQRTKSLDETIAAAAAAERSGQKPGFSLFDDDMAGPPPSAQGGPGGKAGGTSTNGGPGKDGTAADAAEQRLGMAKTEGELVHKTMGEQIEELRVVMEKLRGDSHDGKTSNEVEEGKAAATRSEGNAKIGGAGAKDLTGGNELAEGAQRLLAESLAELEKRNAEVKTLQSKLEQLLGLMQRTKSLDETIAAAAAAERSGQKPGFSLFDDDMAGPPPSAQGGPGGKAGGTSTNGGPGKDGTAADAAEQRLGMAKTEGELVHKTMGEQIEELRVVMEKLRGDSHDGKTSSSAGEGDGALEAKVKELEEMLANAQDALKDDETIVANLEDELAAAKAENSEAITALEALQKELAAKDEELQTAKESADDALERLALAETEAADGQEALKKQMSEDREKALQEEQEREEELKREKSVVEEGLEKELKEKAEAEARIAELEAKVQELDEMLANAQDALKDDETIVAGLEEELASAKSQLEAEVQNRQVAENESSKASAALEALQAELEAKERDLQAAKEATDDALEKLALVETEAAEGQEALQKAAKEGLETQNQEKAKADKSLGDAQARIADIEAQLKELEQQLKAATEAKDEALESLMQANSKGEKSSVDLEELRKELEEKKAELQAAQETADDALEKLAIAQTEAAEGQEALKKQMEAAKAEGEEELKRAKSEVEEGLEKEQREKAEAEKGLKDAAAKIAELEAKMKEQEEELNTAKESADDALERLALAQTEAAEGQEALKKQMSEDREKALQEEQEREEELKREKSVVEEGLEKELKEKAEAEARIAELEAKVQELDEMLANAQDALKDDETIVAGLEDELAASKGEREAEAEARQVAETESQTLKDEVAALKAGLQAAQETADDALEKLAIAQTEAAEGQEALKKQMEAAKAEGEEELKRAKSEVEEGLEKEQREKAEAEKGLKDAAAKIAELEAKMKEQEEELNTAKESADDALEKFAMAETAAGESKDAQEKSEEAGKRLEAELKSAADELEELTRRLEKAEAERKAKEEEVERLGAKLEEKENELLEGKGGMESQKLDLEREKRQLGEKLGEMVAQLAGKEADMEDLRRRLEDAEQTGDSRDSQLEDLQKKLELEQLSKKLEAEEADKAKAQLSELRKKLEEAEGEGRLRGEELEIRQAELTAARVECEAQAEQLEELRAALAAAMEESRALGEQSAKSGEMDDVLAALRQQLDAKDGELQSALEAVGEAKAQLDAAERDVKSSKAAIEQMEIEKAQEGVGLEARLEASRKEAKEMRQAKTDLEMAWEEVTKDLQSEIEGRKEAEERAVSALEDSQVLADEIEKLKNLLQDKDAELEQRAGEAQQSVRETKLAGQGLAEQMEDLGETVEHMEAVNDELKRELLELEGAAQALKALHGAVCLDGWGTTGGVGITVVPIAAQGKSGAPPQSIKIGDVTPGGAADRDGEIRPDDTLLEVDGKAVDGLSKKAVTEMIKGKAGTPVKLKARHGGQEDTYEVTLTRTPKKTAGGPDAAGLNQSAEDDVIDVVALETEGCEAAKALHAELERLRGLLQGAGQGSGADGAGVGGQDRAAAGASGIDGDGVEQGGSRGLGALADGDDGAGRGASMAGGSEGIANGNSEGSATGGLRGASRGGVDQANARGAGKGAGGANGGQNGVLGRKKEWEGTPEELKEQLDELAGSNEELQQQLADLEVAMDSLKSLHTAVTKGPGAANAEQYEKQGVSPPPMGGVGITLLPAESRGPRGGQLMKINSVTPGGAAEASGQVEPEDVLLEVEGSSVEGLDKKSVTELIRGPVGTQVMLKAVRGPSRAPYQITLSRMGKSAASTPLAGGRGDSIGPADVSLEEEPLTGADAEFLGKEGCAAAIALHEELELLRGLVSKSPLGHDGSNADAEVTNSFQERERRLLEEVERLKRELAQSKSPPSKRPPKDEANVSRITKPPVPRTSSVPVRTMLGKPPPPAPASGGSAGRLSSEGPGSRELSMWKDTGGMIGMKLSDDMPHSVLAVRELLDEERNNVNHWVSVGDVLLEVDGTRVDTLPKHGLHRVLGGEIGSLVTLKLRSQTDEQDYDATLLRHVYNPPSESEGSTTSSVADSSGVIGLKLSNELPHTVIAVREVLDVDGKNISHMVNCGDVLLEVDGARVEHLPKRSLHRKMAGEVGSVVNLRFCAGGTREIFDITVLRHRGSGGVMPEGSLNSSPARLASATSSLRQPRAGLSQSSSTSLRSSRASTAGPSLSGTNGSKIPVPVAGSVGRAASFNKSAGSLRGSKQ